MVNAGTSPIRGQRALAGLKREAIRAFGDQLAGVVRGDDAARAWIESPSTVMGSYLHFCEIVGREPESFRAAVAPDRIAQLSEGQRRGLVNALVDL